MASGRPRQPNDPSVFASVEAAFSTVARPSIFGLAWQWRYELAIAFGIPSVATAIGLTFGAAALIATVATAAALFTAAAIWPPARKRVKARAWCVITEHRVRTGCANAWVQSRNGRLPIVVRTKPTEYGERVTVWCRAGITADDLAAARDIIATACWAREVRVIPSPQLRHIVTLDVIRTGHVQARTQVPPWPQQTDTPAMANR